MRSNSFGTSFIRLCVRMCFAVLLSLSQPPSLHRLRCRFLHFVQRLRRYYGAVRLPASVHRRLVNFVLHGAFLCTIVIGKTQALPVLAHGVSVHARGLRPRGSAMHLPFLHMPVLPSANVDGVAPRSYPFRGSILRLHVPLSLLHIFPHGTCAGLGPSWLATPSM